MDNLTPTQRRDLRAKAHHLEPVVTVGHHGLTPQVLREVDVALKAHELVKVRVLGDDRDAREAMLAEACAALDCAAVQHVGKVLVVWRPNPDKKKKVAAEAPKARPARKPGPRKPVDAVRERRRKAGSEWGAAATSGTGRRGEARHARPVAKEAPAAKAPATPRRRTRGS